MSIPNFRVPLQGLPLSELADHPIVRHPALIGLFMSGQVLGVAFFHQRIHLDFAPAVDLNVVMIGLASTMQPPVKIEKVGEAGIAIQWEPNPSTQLTHP